MLIKIFMASPILSDDKSVANIRICDDTWVTNSLREEAFLSQRVEQMKLWFTAPKDTPVHRKEIHE
jgi:sRNA-binding carbon storage regulator CsrA